MILALKVLAKLPAMSGAGVRDAAGEFAGFRLSDEVLACGSVELVKCGEITERRCS
jgi:hypothetical protein